MLDISDLQTGKKKVDDQPQWQPNERENKLIQRLDEEMTIATRYRSAFEEQWSDNIERFEAKPFFDENGTAGVVLPICKWIIESKQATESKSPPSWSYQPKEYKEDREIAHILDEVVKKHVWNLKYVNLDLKLDLMNQDKDILGGMYQYVGWRTIYRTIRNYKEKKGDTEEKEKSQSNKEMDRDDEDSEYESKQDMFYDDIVVDNIHPQDVWLHPLALGVFDSPWIKVRRRFSYNTFLETFSDSKVYKNVDRVRPGKWYLRDDQGRSFLKDYATTDKDQVVVFEEWNIMRDELVIRANGVIIFEGPNPYEHKELPYVDYIDRLQFNTYVGEGEPQRIASICDAINAFLNIAIKKEKISGSGLNLLDDNGSDFDDVSTMFAPDAVSRVSDPKNSFQHFELPGMNSSTREIINMLMDYLIFATGVDFRQITDMSASTQATVAAIRREITQGRLNLNVKRNENRGYKRLGWLLMKLVQQYYPLPLLDKVSGKAGSDKTLEYRKIKIKGKNISEKPVGNDESGNPKYTSQSLVMSEVGDNEFGFFQARPSYIRTKGDLEVQVIGESTFAASRELEKANAKDYVSVASSTFEQEVDPATGQPMQKPILSVRYGLKKLVESYGYDQDQAFNTEDQQTENTARQEAEKFLNGGGGGGAPPPQPGMNKQLPPEKAPAKLVGANSEPVQDFKTQLGAANNITR